MERRELIDEEFTKIYGRHPSASERQRFMMYRPKSHFFGGADLERRENTPLAESVWNIRRAENSPANSKNSRLGHEPFHDQEESNDRDAHE